MAFVLDIEKIVNRKEPEYVWCDYDEDVGVELKIMSMDDYVRIVNADGVLKENIFREAIRDWKGFYDMEEKPLPVSSANIDAVMNYFVKLAQWVDKQLLSLAEKAAYRKIEKIKN